jgi:hypothetical protein
MLYRNVPLVAQGRAGPQNKAFWQSIDDLEIVVAEYIYWLNYRLHGEIGLVRPSEHEDNVYRHNRGDYLRRVSSDPPLNPGRDTCSTAVLGIGIGRVTSLRPPRPLSSLEP